MGWPTTSAAVEMIWVEATRALPSTAPLSRVGAGGGFWAASGAASARPAAVTRAAISRMRSRRRWEVRAGPVPARSGSGLLTGQGAEYEAFLVLGNIDFDLVPAADFAQQDLFAERILDVALDGAAQRAGTEVLVIALLDQEIERGGREPHFIAQPALNFAQQDRDDARNMLPVQR